MLKDKKLGTAIKMQWLSLEMNNFKNPVLVRILPSAWAWNKFSGYIVVVLEYPGNEM